MSLLGQFVLYVLAQVVFLNGIDYLHLFSPYLFILFVLTLPTEMGRISQMLWAFAIGLVVDIFSNTTGIHAGACVFIAYIRPAVCRLFASSESSAQTPSFRSYGVLRFMQYAAILVFTHHFVFYLLENMSMNHLDDVILRTVCSSLLTLLLIASVEYFKYRHSNS